MLTAGGRFRTQKVLTAEEAAQRAHILKRALYKRPRTLRGKAAFFFYRPWTLRGKAAADTSLRFSLV